MSDAFAKNQEAAHKISKNEKKGNEIAKHKEAAHEIADNKEAAQKYIEEAWKTGDIDLLYYSLSLHPEILDEIDKKRFVGTPLHEAAKLGYAQFCAEMVSLMPSFGKKLNPAGFSPLHLALDGGNHDAALALVRIDKELVRVKGRDGITPLMYCARFHGEVYRKTLALFLRDCPRAIFDLSRRSETALHIALKFRNCTAAVMILNWLERSSREKILHWKDDEGNTALHLAVKYKCIKVIKLLVKKTRLNSRNSEGHTPLDIAEEVRCEESTKLLVDKKAKRASKLAPKLTYAEFLMSRMTFCQSTVKTYTTVMNELNVEMRNVVLVVAVLIATATYTAMLQPPGGIYQASASATHHFSADIEQKSNAGKMVMDHPNYERFMPTNTLAFTLAVVVIIFVLPGRPYTYALQLSLMSLSYSCLIAMHYVSEEYITTADVSFFLCWSLLALASAVKFAHFLLMEGFFRDVWWMPHYSARLKNCADSIPLGDQEKMPLANTITNLRKQYRLTVGSLNEKP